jgi:NAD(P)-dependent dehydrogenase (short-subunit alcohol dehydrogenase family)
MTERFDGRRALVTGSTRGIGEAIVRRLADEGASVVVSGRTAEEGEAVAAAIRETGGEASFVRADMRDPESIEGLIEEAVDTYGGVDVLVNNAAVETNTGADEATREDWDLVVETDFRGYWLCAREAVRHMDEGAIVNVSSNHARLTMPSMFPYNAVKSGIEGMTRAMALDFGPRVRVNAVAPGWIAVDRTMRDTSEERRRELASIHPVGRIGDPGDVAASVAFLASDEAGYITGASLVVDGGRTAVMQDDTLPDYAARRED